MGRELGPKTRRKKKRPKRNLNADNFFTQEIEEPQKAKKELKLNKDYGLSIFHALGKFLYNKRIDPRTKKERVMTSKELRVSPKPKSYIKHEEVLNKVQTENHIFSLYLQENTYDMFNDIEDLSKVLEVYSKNDMISTVQDYSFANTKYYDEVQDQCSLSEALAVTEYNIFGGDSTDRKKMKKFVKPQWFDLKRKIRENKTVIFDTTRVDQIWNKEIISEGLLTASWSKIATEYLPHLRNMRILHKYEALRPLLDIRGLENNSHKSGIEKEEQFNDRKEQAFQEKEEAKKHDRQRQQKRKENKDGLATMGKQDQPSQYQQEEIEDSDDEIDDQDLIDVLEDLDSDSE